MTGRDDPGVWTWDSADPDRTEVIPAMPGDWTWVRTAVLPAWEAGARAGSRPLPARPLPPGLRLRPPEAGRRGRHRAPPRHPALRRAARIAVVILALLAAGTLIGWLWAGLSPGWSLP